MKIIITVLIAFTSQFFFSQVGIETTTPHPDAILDFATGQNKGIVLPMVENLPSGLAASNGTILIDKSDGKIKIKENDKWIELTRGADLSSSIYDLNGSAEVGSGVIIGSETTDVEGVLVLESTNKGLMLPKVASPHLNIKSPYPGLVCYDTDRNEIAVFDGSGWFYWK